MKDPSDSRRLTVAAGQLDKEKDYWLKKLSGQLEKCYFPYDDKSTIQREGKKDTVKFRLNQNLFSKLMRLSNNFDPRLHMVLVTGLVALLNKYTGSNDIIVGAPIYKQQQEGQFTNTVLVLRNRLKSAVTFKTLLLQTRETIVEAVENQAYPVERLLDNLDIHETSEGNDDFPLCDTALLLQNIHDRKYLQGLHLNMIFSFLRTDEGLEGEVEYNAAVYRETTVERIVRGYQQLLQNAVNDVNLSLPRIDILTAEEREQLLVDFNNTDTARQFTGTIHELFEQQVARTPGNTAIAGTAITYKELNHRSNQLARVLRKNGVNSESVVGIMLDPSPEMMVALMAILKSGGAYLPIDSDLPEERVLYMLKNSGASILVSNSSIISTIPFTVLQNVEARQDIQVVVTPPRPYIKEFDQLPRPDRGLINLKNYKNKIGMASVTNCISLQATRGCPYQCLYCHKIWAKTHIYRNPENIYKEIEYYYKNGVTNFAFIDDCFNLNRDKSSRLFQLIIRNKLKVQLFFPNGLRGDIMTPDYIDQMVEAGTRGINLSLETASPRLQKLLMKHLDLDKFKQVMDYIASQHPHVILEMASMHGFPTETEEEAMMTLDFIKSIRWLHFPYIHILKIFPNTEMETFALEHGVSKRDIMISKDRAFHELPETLPFPKSFTRKYQAELLNDYFLSKERLKQVLPHQMNILSEMALAQKYNAYLPVEINTVEDIIQFAQLEDIEIPPDYRQEKHTGETIFDRGPAHRELKSGTKKILLLDLSQHFSSHRMLYKVVEQPLGLVSLLTHLNRRFGDQIDGRIYKAGNDFDSFEELRTLVEAYKPDLVGVRTLTFFKEFLHETVAMIRQWGFQGTLITGGPYASSDYDTILKDKNIDLVVFGEGEYTLAELLEEMLDNNFELPPAHRLDNLKGIAYAKRGASNHQCREIMLLDRLAETVKGEAGDNLESTAIADECQLAYVMYTSGSTGKPKGVMVEHRQVNNCISWMQDQFNLDQTHVIVNRTNLTFDPSVWEIFWPLYIGAGVKILDKQQRKDAEFLIRLMSENPGLTMMYCPSTLINIMAYLLKTRTPGPVLNLPWLIIGAEPITMETVKDFYNYYEGQMVNTYGPTECTINNTYYFLDPDDQRSLVPIGKPVANNKLYILDPALQLTPVGVPGEIYIAGDSVSRGYINNWEKTALAFIKNPFAPGQFYKTGDIGRWLEDGNIEIRGRVDEQVKIRGYRIELGEIEARLNAHSSVNECVVLVKDTRPSDEKIKTCSNCGVTTCYPNVTINTDGVCNICELYKENKRYIDNYFKNPDQLKKAIKEANKNKRSQYDCLLLYAGGRGAAYAVYQLVEMGLNVLTAAYDNGYFSKADLENIKKITDSLGVDHVVLKHKNSDKILGESIKIASTVCRGCFHTSSSLAGQYAYEKGINVVVGATLSRGQIIENKLLMFLQQNITGEKELENEIKKIQNSAPEIDKTIFNYIDINVINDKTVYSHVKFMDFYRYYDITNEEMIAYLNDKDPYWKSRKTYAIYSTNCPIKQMGDYGHLESKNYHYYGGATSWEKRLGHLTLENLKADLTCKVTKKAYVNFLNRIKYPGEKPVEISDKYLCAYFVPNTDDGSGSGGNGSLVSELRDYLSKEIPGYMIPKYFVQLDRVPLTANGKVDKKSLPEPERSHSRRREAFTAPKTQLEIAIASIWQDILGTDMVGTMDNFFDMGGNSLDIVMVGSKLKEVINKEIPAVTLFSYPTISSLANHLSQDEKGGSDSPKKTDRSGELKKGQRRLRQSLQKRRERV